MIPNLLKIDPARDSRGAIVRKVITWLALLFIGGAGSVVVSTDSEAAAGNYTLPHDHSALYAGGALGAVDAATLTLENALVLDGFPGGSASIAADQTLTVGIDDDNNSATQSFRVCTDGVISPPCGVELFTVDESGSVTYAGGYELPWTAGYYAGSPSGSSCDVVRLRNVDNCSRSLTGRYQIDFAGPPVGYINPICTCTSTGSGGSCQIGSSTGSSAFDIETRNSAGSFADTGFMLTCMAYP